MKDVAPELLEKVRGSFNHSVKNNTRIKELKMLIKSGNATYKEVNEYSILLGEALAKAYQANISSDVLPDGKMYYNIAKNVIEPTMLDNYQLISNVIEVVQNNLNKKAGLGLKTVIPNVNNDRINGILNRLSSEELYDKVSWLLNEPIVNFSQSIVDDAIKSNAEFQNKVGMEPKIVRRVVGNCCEWCRAVEGVYSYPDVPKNVFRRHQRCRCTVEYDPIDGRRQNVHTRRWNPIEESDRIYRQEVEKYLSLKNGLAAQISEHPKMFQSYTPESLKKALEDAGYEVKPLGTGNYKGIPFEEGGGYRVSYGGDRYLQYHPEKRSHHGGAYYRTANGVDGKKRYNMKGEEVDGYGRVKKKT